MTTFFEERTVPRVVGIAAGLALAIWFTSGALPQNLYALSLTQSAVALLAISAVCTLVVAHRRAEAQVLSRAGEEVVLLASFGLLVLAILVVARTVGHRGGALGITEPSAPALVQQAADAVKGAAQRVEAVAQEARAQAAFGGGRPRQTYAGYRGGQPGYGGGQGYRVEEWMYY